MRRLTLAIAVLSGVLAAQAAELGNARWPQVDLLSASGSIAPCRFGTARGEGPIAVQPWAAKWLAPERAWPLSEAGKGVKVAVIDTGVDAAHPQLATAVLPGADFVGDAVDGRVDCTGHGTAVASRAWDSGFGTLTPPSSSHLEIVRSLTPRKPANPRTLIRIASRRVRASRPDHRWIFSTALLSESDHRICLHAGHFAALFSICAAAVRRSPAGASPDSVRHRCDTGSTLIRHSDIPNDRCRNEAGEAHTVPPLKEV